MAGDSSVQPGGLLTGLVPGSRVAGYLLERLVGSGGTAAVFRARDERLGRVVALKLLAAELTRDQGFRQRFLREARAVAAVDHPHIIPVYAAGEADGVLFIAMRFVAGSDLRVAVGRDGGLPPERAAAYFSPVASALDAAHDSGLVHRDVKPANILVDSGPGRPEHVYLSDFGLARGMLSSSGLTRAGQFVGTPDYAAPEQVSGRAVDGRTDQYGLACVAYLLLTGSVLFERDQPMAVLYAHLFEPPPRVTRRRPDLPAAVDQVLVKALAKAPEDRYGSCGAFSDALRQALGVGPYGSAWLGRPNGARAPETTAAAGGEPTVPPAQAAALPSTASLPPASSPVPPSLAAAPSPAPDAASWSPPPVRSPRPDPSAPAARGNVDRGGDRGPCLLRQRAGRGHPGRVVDRFPGPLPSAAVPAVRDRGPHRAAQRVPPHRAGDRPQGPARRPGRVPAARQADRRAGRKLVRYGSRLDERHSGQRPRDRARRSGAPA